MNYKPHKAKCFDDGVFLHIHTYTHTHILCFRGRIEASAAGRIGQQYTLLQSQYGSVPLGTVRVNTVVRCHRLLTAHRQPVTEPPSGHCVAERVGLFSWVNWSSRACHGVTTMNTSILNITLLHPRWGYSSVLLSSSSYFVNYRNIYIYNQRV